MAGNWQPLLFDLNKGLDESTSALEGESSALTVASDVDTTMRGVIRGRPGFVQHDGFGTRTLQNSTDVQGLAISATDGGTATWASKLANIDGGLVTATRYRDALGERAAVVVPGRTWTWEGDRWADRLYGGAARFERVCDLATNQAAGASAPLVDPPTGGPADAWACGSTFGPSRTKTTEYTLLGQGSTEEARVTVSVPMNVPGNSAVLTTGGVSYEAVVVVSGANLNIAIRPVALFSGVASATLFSDAAAVTGTGDAPSICADYDAGVFYVAYRTTTAHTVKILRVDTGANVLTSTTFTYGAGAVIGVWCTNTPASVNKLVVGAVDSVTAGLFTTIRNATTLVTSGIDVNTTTDTPTGPVVLGATNTGLCWMAYRTTTGLDIFTRSLSAASTTSVVTWACANHGLSGSPGNSREIFLAHQPVDVGNGRVVLGIEMLPETGSTGGRAATYYALDITDTWRSASATGTLNNPVILAQGPRDGHIPHWGPTAAVVGSRVGASFVYRSWRFPSLAYRTFKTGEAQVSPIRGVNAASGINEVTLIRPTSDYTRDSTVFSGSVPHQLQRGYVHEVGFPVGRPVLNTQFVGGGNLSAGSYSAAIVWRWTDEAGQIHRSVPSIVYTNSTGAGAQSLRITTEGPLTEREAGTVYIDVYCSVKNAVAGSPMFLQASTISTVRGGSVGITVDIPGLGSTTDMDNSTEQLYTSVGEMANSPINAQGGVATVADRMWVSDGVNLYASKRPVIGVATCWSTLGPLSQLIPATAGRVRALSAVDDKLVILCQRGVYWLGGFGPDNTGQGGAFSPPVKLSDLGVLNERSVTQTAHGAAFIANNAAATGEPTGAHSWLGLIDRSMTVKRVSAPAQLDMTLVSEITASNEREAVWMTWANGGTLQWDFRSGIWVLWGFNTVLRGTCAANGVLWAVGSADIGAFEAAPGSDVWASGAAATTMTITTQHLFANGKDGLGWSRVRSLRVLGELAAGTLTYTALLDQTKSMTQNFNTAFAGKTTWPTDRYAPQWFLPVQKCSSIQVTLAASPANAVWSTLELQVQPTDKRAPANQRG